MSKLLALPRIIPTKLNDFLPLTVISARTQYPCRSHHSLPYPSARDWVSFGLHYYDQTEITKYYYTLFSRVSLLIRTSRTFISLYTCHGPSEVFGYLGIGMYLLSLFFVLALRPLLVFAAWGYTDDGSNYVIGLSWQNSSSSMLPGWRLDRCWVETCLQGLQN